jgi:hypothetical protein
MRWSAAPLAAGLVCLVPAQDRPPGQQPPIFRSGVDVVQVEVSILDRNRRPVRGLTKQDFHVFENGDSQEIIDVQEIELDTEPAPPVWAHAAPVDVATNDLADRRLIAIVMDDLNCCAIPGAPPFMSDRWAIQNAVTTAHRLIDSLGPHDLATIALTHELMPIQRFTNDREALREVVRRFAPVTEARCRPLPPYPHPEADLRWLLITSPQPVKAIVVLGSLVRINAHEVPFCAPRSYTMPDTGGRTVPVVPLSRTPPDLREHPHVPTYRLNVSGLQIDQRQRAFRNSGPNATGGRNFYLTNDLVPAVDDLLSENSSYYLIGFRTSRPTVDGKFRRLDIKVTRNRGYTIRTRPGYRRPSPPPKPGSYADRNAELSRPPATVANLLPSSDIMMTTAVAAFASPGSTSTVVLLTTVDLTHRVEEAPASLSEELTLRTVAYSSAGDAKYDVRMKTSLAVPPGVGWVSTSVPSSLTVVPDRYELWLSAQEPRTFRVGGVFHNIDVPDFLEQTVTVSGVVLGREPAEGTSLPPAIAGLVPIVPTASRTFGQSDAIDAFFRVYQGRRTPLAPVALSIRVLDERGATRTEVNESLGSDRFTSNRAAEYRLRLPLDRLSSGRYLLTIEARQGDRSSPKRDVPFSVGDRLVGDR